MDPLTHVLTIDRRLIAPRGEFDVAGPNVKLTGVGGKPIVQDLPPGRYAWATEWDRDGQPYFLLASEDGRIDLRIPVEVTP